MRMLLKLYPRRIRDRYGDELVDLQSEMEARGDLSRARLICDVILGALLVRPTRQRAHLVVGAMLIIGGLAVAGTILGGRGNTHAPARASHPPVRLEARAARGSSCYVAAAGSSCAISPCTELADRSSTGGAVATLNVAPSQSRPRRTKKRCAAYPHVRPRRPVFVGG